MKNCKEMAEKWNVTERTVITFCKTGKIHGAVKNGRNWQIPDDAQKPIDGRISSGKYIKRSETKEKKPLVTLFTRPRRFGKTLNMDMLRAFFEISEDFFRKNSADIRSF